MANNFDDAPPLERDFAVNSDEVVTLTTIVGSGQFGTIRVLLDGNTIAGGQNQLHQNFGPGRTVRAKTLQVLSVVQDVNPMTNRTEVTHTLTSGTTSQSFHQEFIATRDFGVVFYVATFHFV